MRRQRRFIPGTESMERRDTPSTVLPGMPGVETMSPEIAAIEVDPSSVAYLGWATQQLPNPDPMLFWD